MENECPVGYPADFYAAENCGIVAMSIVSGMSLTDATEWFRKVRPRRVNWRGATHTSDYPAFLREAGKWFLHTRYNKRERIRTVGDYAEWAATDGKFHVISVSKHIVTCKDGWIVDQSERAKANVHWCRNKRVLESFKIL